MKTFITILILFAVLSINTFGTSVKLNIPEGHHPVAPGNMTIMIPFALSDADGQKFEAVGIGISDPLNILENVAVVRMAGNSAPQIYAPGGHMEPLPAEVSGGMIFLKEALPLPAKHTGQSNFGIAVMLKKEAAPADFSVRLESVVIGGNKIKLALDKAPGICDAQKPDFSVVQRSDRGVDGVQIIEFEVGSKAELAFPPVISIVRKDFKMKPWGHLGSFFSSMTEKAGKYYYRAPVLDVISGNDLEVLPVSYKLIPAPNTWQLRADNTGRDLLDMDPLDLFLRSPGGIQWIGANNPYVEFDLQGVKAVGAVEVYYTSAPGEFRVYGKKEAGDEYRLLASATGAESFIPYGQLYFPARQMLSFNLETLRCVKLEAGQSCILTEIVLYGRGGNAAEMVSAEIVVTGKNGNTSSQTVQIRK